MSPAAGLRVELRARRAAQGGEFYSRNPDAIPPTFLKEYLNCTFEHDAWETEPGAILLEGTIPENVGTLVQWTPTAGVYRLIAIGRGGGIYKSTDNGASWFLMAAGLLSANALIVAVECGAEIAGNPRKLVLFGGGHPIVIVGDTSGVGDPGVANPTAPPTGAEDTTTSGAIPTGNYWWVYTFATALGGESLPSPLLTFPITNPLGAKANLTIPVSSESAVTKRRIYRSSAAPQEPYRLVGEIFDNFTTAYVDNAPPGSVSAALVPPKFNSTPGIHRISRPPVDWDTGPPVSGFLGEGRLLGLGSSAAAHQVYVSSGTDHEDFLTLTRIIPVYPGEGEGLVAGFFWKQQGWLFKQPTGIYALDTSALDLDLWRPIRHTGSLGIAGPLAYAIVEGPAATDPFDDVLFLAPDASWHRLTRVAANQEGDAFVSSISELTMGQFIRDVVDLEHIWYAQMIHFGDIQEVQAAVRRRTSPEEDPLNNLRIKCSLRQLATFGLRFHHSNFPSCEAVLMVRKPDGRRRPLAGGYGQVRELHNPDRYDLDGVAAYASAFFTHDDSFQELGEDLKLSMKNFHFVTLEYDQIGQWPLHLDVYIDGRFTERLEIPMARAGFILDVAETDIDHVTSVYSPPIRFTRRLHGRGRRIAFRGWLATPGQRFAIVNLFIGWSPAGITGGNKLRV